MDNPKYELIIYWSEDDQAFIAEATELPGCAADGATYEEAAANIQIVIREWIKTAEELGRPIPQIRRELVFSRDPLTFLDFPSIRCKLLMPRLEKYINATIRQYIRLKKASIEIDIKFAVHPYNRLNFDSFDKFFTDVHFYSICWDQCRKIIKKMSDLINQQWISDFYETHKSTLGKYSKLRNAMEHFDERTGEKISDFGNYDGTREVFTFNGRNYPINLDSIKELLTIYNKFLDLISQNLNKLITVKKS